VVEKKSRRFVVVGVKSWPNTFKLEGDAGDAGDAEQLQCYTGSSSLVPTRWFQSPIE